MIIKENEYQGLQDFDVLIEDNNPNSDYFQVTEFPETIPGGKSFFKIAGVEGLLRPESEIKVEILDLNGEVIYTEYPDFIDESDRRLISVFVYDFVPPGPAVVTILGEAQTFLDGSPIPVDWVGTFNVRWRRRLNVEPFKKNNFPILFETDPAIAVTEIVKPYLERQVPSGSSVTTVGTSNNSDFKISFETRGEGKFYLVSQGGFKFENEMVNSAVTFSALTNPTLNKKPFPQTSGKGPDAFTIDGVELPYHAQIRDIINDSRVLVSNPFALKSEFSKTGKEKSKFDKELDVKKKQSGIFAFDPSNFSISFRKTPTFTPTQNLRSFAKINLNDINTISGDVHHVKTFMKSQGSVGGFELVDETVLEASELLINENSVNLQEPIGEFFSQAIIDDNWVISSSNTEVNEFTASRETSNLNNSAFISGSFRNHSGSVTFTPQETIDFATKGDYELTFKSFVDTDSNSVDDGHIVDIYLTGSSFFSSSGYLEPYGLKIGSLESSGSKYFGKSDIDFSTSETGNGNVLFHIKKGLWRFSDISIRSVRESGFSPATTTLYIPIPDNQKDDVLDFEFKFYDNDNNEASASFKKLDNDFEGGNTFIGGGSNLVTGSVFIGASTGSGMEFAGVNSAFLRSVGYEGFLSASAGQGRPGFLFYSGSVLPNSGDNYDGVGFELNDGVSGSMRFRTDTGVFDVKTPSFFLGSNNQFISGALGNIEISSSNFHLDANGDVLMQGTITATAGEIGGFSVGSDKLSSSTTFSTGGGTATTTIQMSSSGLFSAGDFTDVLKQSHFGVLTSRANPGLSASLVPNNLSDKIESNFAGINRYDGEQQTGFQLNYGNFFKIGGEDGGEAVFRVGKYVHTAANPAPAPYIFFSEESGLEISSSKLSLTNGALTLDGTITANSGEIAGWALSSTSISKNGVELNSGESGLRVVNPAGREVVYVGSRSLMEITGSAETSSFNGSFEISNVPSIQGSGVIISGSNQISGWNLQYTGSAGSIRIESGTTYPSASFIAVDGNNALFVTNDAGVAA